MSPSEARRHYFDYKFNLRLHVPCTQSVFSVFFKTEFVFLSLPVDDLTNETTAYVDGFPVPISVRGGSLLNDGIFNQAWAADGLNALAQIPSRTTVAQRAFTVMIWFFATNLNVSRKQNRDMRLVSVYTGVSDFEKRRQAFDFQVCAEKIVALNTCLFLACCCQCIFTINRHCFAIAISDDKRQ